MNYTSVFKACSTLIKGFADSEKIFKTFMH